MLIVYSPADGKVEHLDLRSVRTNEASIASRNADVTWKQIKERLADDDPEAMRVVAWVILKRTQPSLRLSEFDPLVEELAVRLDRNEVEAWATEAVASTAGTELPPEQILAALQPIVDAAADPEHARELILKLASAPKDPADSDPATEGPSGPTEESTPTGTSTSGSSPTSSTSTPTA